MATKLPCFHDKGRLAFSFENSFLLLKRPPDVERTTLPLAKRQGLFENNGKPRRQNHAEQRKTINTWTEPMADTTTQSEQSITTAQLLENALFGAQNATADTVDPANSGALTVAATAPQSAAQAEIEQAAEFNRIFNERHLAKYAKTRAEFATQWKGMSPEHRSWAIKLDSLVPNLAQGLDAHASQDEADKKARQELIKKVDERESELAAFFLAPTEEMQAGPKKGMLTRRQVYEKAFVKRDLKTADKAGSILGYAATGAAGVAVAMATHHLTGIPGFHFPHAVGELVPAAKALFVYASAAAVGVAALKGKVEGIFKHVKEVAFEQGAWQRLAEDPMLEQERAPMAITEDKKIEWEQKAEKFERLSRTASPADRIELQRLDGKKTMEGLEAVHAWRASVKDMPTAQALTIVAAIKEQKKARANKQASPEWANSELKTLTDLLADKKNLRAIGDLMSQERRAWIGVHAISAASLPARVANASIRPMITVLNANDRATAFAKRLVSRRKNATGVAPAPEPYNPKEWVRPPRVKS